MPSSSSCSHWWHAPVYLAATVVLIIAAISSSGHSSTTTAEDHHLLLALHRSGFHLTALSLHLSTSLHVSSPFTLFALPDSALSSLPSPAAAADLLRSHISPLHLPLSALSSLPRGAQIPTLLPNTNLTLTSPASLNGVPISHPDLFLSGPHVVHGVAVPFPAAAKIAAPAGPKWDLVVRALGGSGAYVAFALGLSAVLDSLMASAPEKVTVFAPRGDTFDYVAMPAEALERAVRRHVAVGRFGYGELVGMRVGEEMRTVAEDEEWGLRITDGEGSGLMRVEVNGVEIVEAEVYVDDGVAVHGIAEDFGNCLGVEGNFGCNQFNSFSLWN